MAEGKEGLLRYLRSYLSAASTLHWKKRGLKKLRIRRRLFRNHGREAEEC